MNRRSALKIFGYLPFMASAIELFAQAGRRLPAHHTEDGFRNIDPNFEERSFTEMAPWVISHLTDLFSRAPKVDIPREYNDGSIYSLSKPYTVTWIGHSTVLIQMEGKNILTDPVWAENAGPLKFAGAKRVSEPGIELQKLPPIDIVLISHNHYDHLDQSSIEKLADRNPKTKFFVPLRVRDWFEDKGIRNVEEFDWWEGTTFLGLKIICTPAQHFSGRWVNDRNQTLWCSWTVLGKKKLFFAGDSGYGSHFKNIGNKFGPFDLALVPIGAYEPRKLMKPVHMNPADAVQANEDLEGKKMLSIHWGTFLMTDEPMDEPPKKLAEAVTQKNLSPENYWAFKLGEVREW
ncbi:MAG: MBL fold metallo-hydrolase [Bacteroidetes bacterium]|nr:MBL fold metallo-hydrolase [Bacteroidota bacterium]